MPTKFPNKKDAPWRGRVKHKGFGPEEVAWFRTKGEAAAWEATRREVIKRKKRGLPADVTDLAKKTIGELFARYLKEEVAYKAGAKDETYTIQNFLAWRKIKETVLIAFQRPQAIEYRNYLEREYKWTGKPYVLRGKLVTPKRKPKGIKAATVRRQIATLRDAWNMARDWVGYESLKEIENPWARVSSTKIPKKRTRRLNDLPTRQNELERILTACNGCLDINKIYMPLAINLTVYTGMREQEIIEYLNWNDIDFKERTINIRKSKSDHNNDDDGRTIVIPLRAWLLLDELAHVTKADKTKNTRIFPMSKTAFKKTFNKIRVRAKIASKEEDAEQGIKESQCGLTFHDLRTEAGSYFDEIGLTKIEHDLMLGHANRELRATYVSPHLRSIRNKLDKADLGGFTLKELEAQGKMPVFDYDLNMQIVPINDPTGFLRPAEKKDLQSPGEYKYEVTPDGRISVVKIEEKQTNVIQLPKRSK